MFIEKIRERFTKWYIKHGYTFGYDFTDVPMYDDGVLRIPLYPPEGVFNCPFWIKPLLIFFSPSVYFHEVYVRVMCEEFWKGFVSL